jgi:predicted secreted protein
MAKFKAKGLIVKIGASNPPTTAVAQLGDSTLNLGEREAAVDVTTHDNSTGTVELMDIGFKTPLSFEGEIIWDPADTVHEVMRAAHDAGTLLYILVILPDTGAAQFIAQVRVKGISAPLPVKGKLSANVSIEGMASTTFTA